MKFGIVVAEWNEEVTNALLEGRGAKVALLTTRGFRDLLYIGRQNRPHLYDFWALKP